MGVIFMYPTPVQKLIDLFTKFPGIGPRQAARFIFFILKEKTLAHELAAALAGLANVSSCAQCFRAAEKSSSETLCTICRDARRDHTSLAIVEKESDMQNLEKGADYRGLYHVLGGVISPLDSDSPQRLHLKELHARIQKLLVEKGNCEVILATNPTTEGDMTALYIDRILVPLKNQFPKLKISRLGRGLSLGSELEYADEVTLKNALKNRN